MATITRSTSPKARRADLLTRLKVAASAKTIVTPEVEAKLRAATLTEVPRVVSEPPDTHYNHSNSTLLRALAGLVVEGIALDGQTGEMWANALDKGHVTVVSETDNETGFREDDILVGNYVVRAAEGGGHHVFKKGSDRSTGSRVDELLAGVDLSD
jgi:hypothetical protein